MRSWRDARQASAVHVLLLLGIPALIGCFSGVKRVGDGEPCITGDQVFSGSVACADDLICVVERRHGDGGHTGRCARGCDPARPCPDGLLCAAGACTKPCDDTCPASFEYSGVCCRFRDQGIAACLPALTCDEAGGGRPGPSGSDDADPGPEAGS